MWPSFRQIGNRAPILKVNSVSAALFAIYASPWQAVAAEPQDIQCEQRSLERFSSVMEDMRSWDKSFVATYTNHFNTRLGKCFSLQVKLHYEQENGLPTSVATMTLIDVDRGAVYATFSQQECRLQNMGCKVNPEWEELVGQLMKE